MKEFYDCIVVGSGAAALTAAITSAKHGSKVLVVEKRSYFGGTSALSGGVAWLPNNPYMAASGACDSKTDAMMYLNHLVGDTEISKSIIHAFYENSSSLIKFLEEHTEVKFEPTNYPDYHSDLPGSRIGRSVGTKEYDGRLLGKWLNLLQKPMASMCLLGGMMVDAKDIYHLMNMLKSFSSAKHVTKRFIRYGLDLVLYRRATRLTIGNALVGRLLKSAIDSNVTLWNNCPAQKLLFTGTQLSGLLVCRDGIEVEIQSPRVILATGGFAHNEELSRQFLPASIRGETLCINGATGDGITMAREHGGVLGTEYSQAFLGNQVYKRLNRSGQTVEQVVHTRRDRNKPGFILVNRLGKRFANEAAPYNELTRAMTDQEDHLPAYLICDHARLRTYGMGLLRPGPAWLRPLSKFIKTKHLIKANTISSLAQQLDMDAAILTNTIAKNNSYASTGVDLEFGKGSSLFDRWQGDPSVSPNPNIGPIDHGPFYATRVWPSNLGTFLGLQTNENAQVLDDSGSPIKGLYACGSDMHHMLRGSYAGGGSVLGPAMVFAYIAGLHTCAG